MNAAKKVLVTGASGLLGLNLGFQAAGRYRVSGVVNSNSLTQAPFEVVTADLGVPGSIRAIGTSKADIPPWPPLPWPTDAPVGTPREPPRDDVMALHRSVLDVEAGQY